MTGFNLSALAVRERAVTLFLIIAVTAAGFFAFQRLGRAEDPAFTVKTMSVSAAWPGATTSEIQRQVADPLEKRLQELVYYDRVETTVRPGLMLMKLYFKDSMPPARLQAEFYQARKKLSDQASALPRGVLGPLFNDEFSDVYFALYALQAQGLPHRHLVLRAEDLRQRLLRVPGVEKINILGEQNQKIYVEISYQRLATLGITGQQLLTALANQNDVTPAGFVETTGPRVYLRLDGAIDGLDTIRNLPVAAGDRSLKLGDIAEVKRGYEDPKVFEIRNDGEPALMLGLVMKPGFNGLALGEALNAEEVAIHHELPTGIAFSKITDQAKVIDDAIHEFMVKFFTALSVVIVVSLVALGFRVGIVVALAVPITLAAVFVVMMVTGRDFDRITLGALIISLGLLVDDAIIAIEMMVVRMEEGVDRVEAATHAWSATAAPMLTGTLVTIAGFLPVGFAASTAGEYAGNIFWVVGFSLIISWIVAVTFTPYLGVKLLPDIKTVAGGHEAIYATKNYQRLRRVVRACVDHKWLAAGITVGLFALAVVGMGRVEKQFFPNSERPELIVEVTLPSGSAFATTEESVRKVEAAIRGLPEAREITSYIGQGMPRFVLSFDPELPDPAFAQIVVQTSDAASRDALRIKLRRLVSDGLFPEARVRVLQIVFGPPIRFPVAFRVTGPDPDVIRGIAAEVRDVMMANPNMRLVHLDWGNKTPSLHLVLDQERLRLIGLTPKEAGQQLQSYLNGTPATQMRENLRSVDVLLRSPGPERRSLGEIGDLTLTTHDGRQVPLSQVARLESRNEDAVLKRYNRETYIRVQGDVLDEKQPPDIHAQIFPALDPIKAKLPPGYRIDVAGAVEESAKAMKALVAVFPLMLIVTLTVIMLQVRSFTTMFMVFATAPLGLVGAAPTLLLFHQPFGFNAILGLIALSGILMRNTLILVDQIHHDRAAGLSDYEAIVESTVRRARPVILTAAAAMLAFIPLTHSVFWGALAYVLIGGVGVGTLLTLLFLPALYALWFRVGRKPVAAGVAPGFDAVPIRAEP
ncbi:acriflavin resistance protein [Methylorubrum populi BJ001]|jgi:multidrug efflux pump subunit AcrB|uniref:Acriflavin resistance protein n=1 Tax=Methylorubrum populi (strain ATCC BAA-705 / NCIMB 13946 / BJ001) TaxID=441620 RepID=B1ZJ32_METPB|nr:efflux RND transporter permease subunit [Methylorubrum populi]ACB78606.1 acriflavin resistance protein [Methylorubrum populi BJ001]OAH20115.1 multidrug transporter [Methylorubrum populi]PZP69903.1 MAG: AcrB/AcrD/AcrF family protein [Methylorubrum populi]